LSERILTNFRIILLERYSHELSVPSGSKLKNEIFVTEKKVQCLQIYADFQIKDFQRNYDYFAFFGSKGHTTVHRKKGKNSKIILAFVSQENGEKELRTGSVIEEKQSTPTRHRYRQVQ
jgi:hypothetical protein